MAEPVIPDFGEASDCVAENRFFCTDWVRENWDPVLQPALVQHIYLTAIAVGVGFVISLGAALLAHRLRYVERPVAIVAAVVYTIPSLALFQLLVPVTGLTVTTVEIALVGYTVLILFRNTLAGLRSVPDDVLEAARGMGLTRNQTLLRVELPLAVPAIIAGLRIAVVSTIALATVAAFVVSKGLGGPILGALRLDFRTEIIAAGALAVGLAIVADGLLVLDPARRDSLGDREERDVILAGLDVFANSLDFIVDRRELLLDKTWEHVELSIAALLLSILIAVPIGVALGHLHRGSFLAVNLANIGRALPTLVVIAVGFTIFGIGYTNVIVALVILGVPPILTNAYVAVDEVDRDAVEAARGMGMTPLQVLLRVEVPLALPLLFAGIRTAAVFIVATATIAAIAGGGGLGDILVNQAAYRVEGLVAAALCVSALALAADALLGLVQRWVTPAGLKQQTSTFEPDVRSVV